MRYTPGQVAELLKIPSSSLSRYAREFSEYLSESARVAGRRRAYTEGDVLILERVRALLLDGVPLGEVAARLRVVEGVLRQEGENQSTLQIIPTLAAKLEHAENALHNALTILDGMSKEVERIPELERRLSELERELREYRDTPWYKRVFRR